VTPTSFSLVHRELIIALAENRPPEPRDELPPSHQRSPEAAMWGSLSGSGSRGNGLHLAEGPTSCDLFCGARGRLWPFTSMLHRNISIAIEGIADRKKALGITQRPLGLPLVRIRYRYRIKTSPT
jgi:hypothetical protein